MNATSKKKFPNVRAALYGQPWAITEQGMDLICEVFETHVAGRETEWLAAKKSQDDDEQDDAPPFEFENGVAVIPIQGPIFPRANLFTELSGATSLQDVSNKLDIATSLQPTAIIFDINSPGGAVSGLLDFCNEVMEARRVCDVIGLCNPMAGSAAYMIASQCSFAYGTEGSVVGSIGTLAKINNYDRAERNEGNDVITLSSSELKSGGTDTLNRVADLQRMVQGYFDQFKATVKRGRPDMDVDAAATGQTWLGKSHNSDKSAVDMGLIDGITTMDSLKQQYAMRF